MWLKDCQDHLMESSRCNTLYGSSRRLRHLLPKPTASITKNTPYSMVSSTYCGFINSSNHFSMNPHHHHQTSSIDEQSNKDEKQNSMEQIVSSSRWNPTPEQLMALEEMYRRGVRTPSSEEIKLISAKLRQFGKIEAKNVFYWFQNHKARERQKRRRQPPPPPLESSSTTPSNKIGNDNNETLEGPEKGLISLEGEENNKLITSSKESKTIEKPVGTEMECEGEIIMQQMSQWKMGKGATKQMTDLSCRASLNQSDILNSINASFPAESSSSKEAAQQKKMLSALTSSIFSSSSYAEITKQEEDAMARDHRTLELFPLQKDGYGCCPDTIANNADFQEFMTSMNPNLPPNHFYEFL